MKKLIEDSGLLDKIRRRANYKKVFEQTADRLLNIISPKNHYLLNVYKLIEGDESQDIELSILRSILNGIYSLNDLIIVIFQLYFLKLERTITLRISN